jgi:hypothetical protein
MNAVFQARVCLVQLFGVVLRFGELQHELVRRTHNRHVVRPEHDVCHIEQIARSFSPISSYDHAAIQPQLAL